MGLMNGRISGLIVLTEICYRINLLFLNEMKFLVGLAEGTNL